MHVETDKKPAKQIKHNDDNSSVDSISKSFNDPVVPPDSIREKEKIRLWHSRLGHLSKGGMDKLMRMKVNGLKFSTKHDLDFCDVCAIAKSHAQARSTAPREKAKNPLERLFMDLWEITG